MIKIDLKDYVLSGEGNNGQSYDSVSEPDIMVKLYKKGYDTDAILLEHELAAKVFGVGVPSPEPGELVTDGERIGIRFRRIAGKRSYARAISQEPDRVEEFARDFAVHCKELHAMECPDGLFPDAREGFQKLLDADKVLSPHQKEQARDFLWNRIPESRTLLHGDLHFGNALTTVPAGVPMASATGKANGNFYFIDLGYFAYGCPLMDLGMTYLVCRLSDEEFLRHDMHFGRDLAARAWAAFREEYFFGPEKLARKWFGADEPLTPEKVDELMKPYAFLKLLLVEYNVGFLPPAYTDFFTTVFV